LNNEETVIIRLVTGEQLIARLLNNTPDGILVFRPIVLKYYPAIENGKVGEKLTTALFSPLSCDESFVFDIRHCISISKLHSKITPHYLNVSEDLYASLDNAVQQDHHEEVDDYLEEQLDNGVYH
jgi:hypothetical protein